jgi:hypothetical protein
MSKNIPVETVGIEFPVGTNPDELGKLDQYLKTLENHWKMDWDLTAVENEIFHKTLNLG